MNVQPLLSKPLIELRSAFQLRGFDIRFVGGCVRDLMLSMQPKDIDLCTDANPVEQIEIYQSLGVRYIETGLQHGTITVILDDVSYEITSLRIDLQTNGRHATVDYTRDWIEDLRRRDFTINAMSLTFDNELIDPFGGLQHLQDGLVMFVGDAESRIKEDYLRILRWFRFRGRFGMSMGYSARRAVRDHAVGLQKISRERVWSEISRILVGNDGPFLLSEMHQLGVAEHIGIPIDWYPNVVHAQEVATLSRNPVTLLVSLYSVNASSILRHWKASNREINLAKSLWWSTETSSLFFRSPYHAMAVGGWTREDAIELAKLNLMDQFDLAVLEHWPIPSFPVNGNDLLLNGMSPGPHLGDRLNMLKQTWAESGFKLTKQELLEIVS